MRIILMVLLFPAFAFADLSFDYTSMASSGFKFGQATENFYDSQHNAMADALKTDSPYLGGTKAGINADGQFEVGGLWVARTSQTNGFWGSTNIIGTISANSSGTLNVQYDSSKFYGWSYLSYENFGFTVGKNNFSQVLFDCSSLVGLKSCSIPVNAGDQLDFFLWYQIGSQNQPIYNSSITGAIIDVSYSLVPEPATLTLMIGAIALCRRYSRKG